MAKVGLPVAKKVLSGTAVGENLPSDETFVSDKVYDVAEGMYKYCCPSFIQKNISKFINYAASRRVINNTYTHTGLAFTGNVLQVALVEFLAIKASGKNANKINILNGNGVELATVGGMEYLSGVKFGAFKGAARVFTGELTKGVVGSRSTR